MCQDRAVSGVQGVHWCWSLTALRSRDTACQGSVPQSLRNDRKGLTHMHKVTVIPVVLRKPLIEQMRLGPVSLPQVPPELSLLSPLPGYPGAIHDPGRAGEAEGLEDQG